MVMQCRRRQGRTRAAAVGVALLAVFSVATCPPGLAAEGVALTARIDGRGVGEATESRPVRLSPTRPADVALQVTNGGSAPIVVRTVRLEGTVMGLAFFAYETTTELVVEPGAREDLAYSLDLGDLRGQATGLVVGSVTLLDEKREALASQRTVYDVRGSLRSVYGVFGLVVTGLTVVSFAAALIALARHRLPENRFRRALRFVTPGLGLGLTLVFALSATRVFVPRPGRWIPILLICAVAGFATGYLTPSPEEDDDGEFDEGEPTPSVTRAAQA